MSRWSNHSFYLRVWPLLPLANLSTTAVHCIKISAKSQKNHLTKQSKTPGSDGKSQFQADIEPNFVFWWQNLMKVCGSVHPPIWQSANRNKGSKCFCISFNINNLDNNCKNVELFIKIRPSPKCNKIYGDFVRKFGDWWTDWVRLFKV